MISDDDLFALSEDDEEAFVQYEMTVRKHLDQNKHANTWAVEREYVSHILAFLEVRPIKIDLRDDPPDADNEFADWFEQFTRVIDRRKATLRLQAATKRKQNSSVLELSVSFKTQISGHLTAIRSIVGRAELPDKKREAISKRINNLQNEVDRDRTRTEAAMGLLLEVTSAIGNGAKNLDPAIDRLERIVKVFSMAKDENETKALPAPDEIKQIEPPADSRLDGEGLQGRGDGENQTVKRASKRK